MDQKIKKNRPVAGWILIVVALLCVIGIHGNVTRAEDPWGIVEVAQFAILPIGFAGLGILLLMKNIKGFGWGVGAICTLFPAIFWAIQIAVDGKSIKTALLLLVPTLAITVVFALLMVRANRKKEQ